MQVKRILLTGDDGINSIGTRLLVNLLKDKYDLFIAGTADQKSGVGGHVSLKNGGKWGETTVDGVPAFWVDGYPCDAIECLPGNFPGDFDLVISGINFGMNIGSTLGSSGTYTAGIRALDLKIAPQAIITSWFTPQSFWHMQHPENEDLTPYIACPGKIAGRVLDLALANDLWGASVININFPETVSKTVTFTKPLENTSEFFNYPTPLNRENHTFAYSAKPMQTVTKDRIDIDTGALLNGCVSITLQRKSMFDEILYSKIKTTVITL
jgi:5'-nucleotidase